MSSKNNSGFTHYKIKESRHREKKVRKSCYLIYNYRFVQPSFRAKLNSLPKHNLTYKKTTHMEERLTTRHKNQTRIGNKNTTRHKLLTIPVAYTRSPNERTSIFFSSIFRERTFQPQEYKIVQPTGKHRDEPPLTKRNKHENRSKIRSDSTNVHKKTHVSLSYRSPNDGHLNP